MIKSKWEPPSHSELTIIYDIELTLDIFNMELTHLGSEASKYYTKNTKNLNE